MRLHIPDSGFFDDADVHCSPQEAGMKEYLRDAKPAGGIPFEAFSCALGRVIQTLRGSTSQVEFARRLGTILQKEICQSFVSKNEIDPRPELLNYAAMGIALSQLPSTMTLAAEATATRFSADQGKSSMEEIAIDVCERIRTIIDPKLFQRWRLTVFRNGALNRDAFSCSIGGVIRERRKDAKLTVPELARRADTTTGTLTQIEGGWALPAWQKLLLLCKTTRTPLHRLFRASEERITFKRKLNSPLHRLPQLLAPYQEKLAATGSLSSSELQRLDGILRHAQIAVTMLDLHECIQCPAEDQSKKEDNVLKRVRIVP